MSSMQSNPDYIRRRTDSLRRAAEARAEAYRHLREVAAAELRYLETVDGTLGCRVRLTAMLAEVTQLESIDRTYLADVLQVRRELGSAR